MRHLEQPLTVRPAAAADQAFAVGVVIVCELFAPPYRPGRPNPDDAVLDVDIAVRAAGMIDEPCDVSADARINDCSISELEAPDMTTLDVSTFPLEAFLIRDLLACVVNNPLVLGDAGGTENAPAMNRRPPFFNHPRSILPG